MSEDIEITSIVVVSNETYKHPDLVFQQHLRGLIQQYREMGVPEEALKGVLLWEANHLPNEIV